MIKADDAPDLDKIARLDIAEPRQPAVSRQEFSDALSRMASSVCVVTAGRDGEQLGRTVTAAFSLNANPPSVLVSIDQASPLADMILKARAFSVQLLAEGQEEIGDAFAGLGEASERFAKGKWAKWPSGQPVLAGSAASLDCELIGSIDAGTHMLFAGAIIHTDIGDARPLLWYARNYSRLET